jgi:hypothetical protein
MAGASASRSAATTAPSDDVQQPAGQAQHDLRFSMRFEQCVAKIEEDALREQEVKLLSTMVANLDLHVLLASNPGW